MKRLLSLLLAMAFIFVFAGCENEKTAENQKESASQETIIAENESTNQDSAAGTNESDSQITVEDNTTLPSDENSGSQNSSDNTTVAEADEFISKAEAKKIALSKAGVKESEIRDYEIELDREQGVYYYEISFDAGGFEYEYDIDAKSGKIARSYKEKED